MTGTHLSNQEKERTPIYDNISCDVANLLSKIGTKINWISHLNDCTTHLAFRSTVEYSLQVRLEFRRKLRLDNTYSAPGTLS